MGVARGRPPFARLVAGRDRENVTANSGRRRQTRIERGQRQAEFFGDGHVSGRAQYAGVNYGTVRSTKPSTPSKSCGLHV